VAAVKAPGVEAYPPLPASVGGAGAGAAAGWLGGGASCPTQEAALLSGQSALEQLEANFV
jgi:hypothetical protein